MRKLITLAVALVVAAVAYVAHARSAGAGEVAHCLKKAGASVRYSRPSARADPGLAARWETLLRRGDGQLYAIDLDGDRGTLIQIRSGISATHLQGALDAGGADVTAQSSGRILMLWKGRPSASSAATLNRCLPL
jgi:hypothetical protein